LIDSYWTQLEAYVYAFENPLDGDVMPIKSIGLLQWRIADSLHMDDNKRGFSVDHRYIPIPRQPEKFQDFLARFIGIIEGEFPESGSGCETCAFLERIDYVY
jgi:hypothetical protein